jgi:hypothetical protein
MDAIGPYGVVFGIFGSKPLPHPLPQIVAEFFGVQLADTLKYIITCPEDCAEIYNPTQQKICTPRLNYHACPSGRH